MTPRQWQVFVAAAMVLTAVVLQTAVISRLPLPGASVGLALAVVIAIGMSGGATFGAVAGFATGMLLDVSPPATGVMAVTAFAFLVAGALAGRVHDPRGLAPAQVAVMLIGLTALTGAILMALEWLLADSMPPLLWLLTFVVYTTVLGVFVVPGVAWVLRRVGPGPRRRDSKRRVVPA